MSKACPESALKVTANL